MELFNFQKSPDHRFGPSAAKTAVAAELPNHADRIPQAAPASAIAAPALLAVIRAPARGAPVRAILRPASKAIDRRTS